ncbi:hypothetical protein TNCV_196431 [Trichonephila clavipes]|uniref:Uncharacterized protein n=1 Tax=Trichonephila clavipes TaxID=2585209 RepID=A0A8X6WIL8_TRICX|nr:hypothetical protein TNCV_196431 [Trichonephila clavipes]
MRPAGRVLDSPGLGKDVVQLYFLPSNWIETVQAYENYASSFVDIVLKQINYALFANRYLALSARRRRRITAPQLARDLAAVYRKGIFRKIVYSRLEKTGI